MTEWISADGPVAPTMRAVTIREFGDPDVLRLEQVPTPTPGPDEVLVRVNAVSVGRLLDLLARSGNHPYASFTFPHILGAEFSGVAAVVGTQVTTVRVGDRVAVFPLVFATNDEETRAGYPELSPAVELIGTHRPGAYAEYVAAPAVNMRIVPDDISPEEATALVAAGSVAMNQFTRAGGVGHGTRVVVQGATSALGLTTALLAKYLGAEVIVTSRYETKREVMHELGFSHVLDPLVKTFADDIRAAFGGRGAHIVIDNLGVPHIWSAGMQALAPGGAIVSSGAFLGTDVPVNAKALYTYGHRVIGVRTGNLASLDLLWDAVNAGFRTSIDRSFALEDASAAHRYVENDANIGRVVLVVK